MIEIESPKPHRDDVLALELTRAVRRLEAESGQPDLTDGLTVESDGDTVTVRLADPCDALEADATVEQFAAADDLRSRLREVVVATIEAHDVTDTTRIVEIEREHLAGALATEIEAALPSLAPATRADGFLQARYTISSGDGFVRIEVPWGTDLDTLRKVVEQHDVKAARKAEQARQDAADQLQARRHDLIARARAGRLQPGEVQDALALLLEGSA